MAFFLEHGAHVAALTRSSGDVESLTSEFAGSPFEAMQGDVTRRADLERLRDSAIKRFGLINGLVNKAGIRQRKDFMALTREEFGQVIASNLTSCFEAMQVFAAPMIAHGGGALYAGLSLAVLYRRPGLAGLTDGEIRWPVNGTKRRLRPTAA